MTTLNSITDYLYKEICNENNGKTDFSCQYHNFEKCLWVIHAIY